MMQSTSQPARAVLFDVYGTLVEIQSPRRPYQRLVDLAQTQNSGLDRGRAARLVMCHAGGLAESAKRLGVALQSTELQQLDQALREEIASIQPYPETEDVLGRLRARGLKIGLCSNLASPYVSPAMQRLGHLIDCAVWSCEAGVLKPDPTIFGMAVQGLRLELGSVLMIGDSYAADVLGAREAGLKALWLDRKGARGDLSCLSELLDQ